MKNILFSIFFLTLLSSCQKVIDIDLNLTASQVVIEGEINDQTGIHTVKVSKTVNFSDANNYPAVQGATVMISDNAGRSETLTETSAGIYKTRNLLGIAGRKYTLIVNIAGKIYTAVSTMPVLVPLQGIRLIPNPRPGQDTIARFVAIPNYIDPPTFGNCYRFVQTLNGKEDKNFIVFNDNVNNGFPNQRPAFSRDLEIKRNDTLTVEMRNIDKPVYDYFYSLNQSAGNGPGGGSTPANPVNNIDGGALGYFSAYSASKKTVIVQ
ncbi:MAG: hypothetical protein RLZZ628_3489 [Bacteroidota bacterium]|jgi:hypothetical protein